MRLIGSGTTLDALVACLRGEPPTAADWSAVFALANRTLLTPALYGALSRARRLDALPDDGRDYLAFLHARNVERNTRLRAQLIEAVGELNKFEIEPILLKGAVRLFCDAEGIIGDRITRDLDLAVDEAEGENAAECLRCLGYRDASGTRGMERPQDVGVLELRHRPSALSAAYLPRERQERPRLITRAAVRAKIPSATSRAQHWIVHDLIKEGDYWRGCIDLRHLHDLAELERTEGGVDWIYIRDSMPDQLGRNAVETQLLTLHSLFRTDIPPALRDRAIVHLQHQRRMITARHPLAGAPLRFAGNLAWGIRRLGEANSVTLLPGQLASKVFRNLVGRPGDWKL